MARKWTPGKTLLQIQVDWEYLTVVATTGSVDANPGQEFRVRNGTVCRYDIDQSDQRPGYRVIVIDREDGRQVRTKVRTKILRQAA